jgi:O-antigen/teichoic acid export membrane protein
MGGEAFCLTLAIVVSAYLARTLGPEGCGALFSLVFLTQLALAIGMFGIDRATVFHVGKGVHETSAVSGNALVLSLVLGVVIASVFALAAAVSGQIGTMFNLPYFLLVVATIPLIFPSQVAYHAIWGQNRIEACTMLRTSSAISGLAMNLTFIGLLAMGLEGAVWAHVASSLIYVAMALTAVRFGGRIDLRPNRACLKSVIGYGLRSYVGAVLGFLLIRLDILMLLFLADSKPKADLWIGLYSRAIIVERVTTLIAHGAAMPLLGQSVSSASEEVRHLTARVLRLTVLACLVAGVIFSNAAEFILWLLFGDEFLGAADALKILVLGMVGMAAARIASTGLQALDKPGLVSLIALVVIPANLLLNWILIPTYGIEGAAAATTISYLLNGALCVAAAIRVSGGGLGEFLLPSRDDFALAASWFNRRSKQETHGPS